MTSTTPVENKVNLNDPKYYFNRELSWLEFNRRVLAEALDKRTPLLERLKFMGIFSSNLDEFFMVRVAALKKQVVAGVSKLSADGRTPQQQLNAIAQLLQDEVNHLAKFWGFSRWAFAGSFAARFQKSAGYILALAQHHKSDRSHGNKILSIPQMVVHAPHAVELGFAFLRVMVWLRHWDKELSPSFLTHLFGPAPHLNAGQVQTVSV